MLVVVALVLLVGLALWLRRGTAHDRELDALLASDAFYQGPPDAIADALYAELRDGELHPAKESRLLRRGETAADVDDRYPLLGGVVGGRQVEIRLFRRTGYHDYGDAPTRPAPTEPVPPGQPPARGAKPRAHVTIRVSLPTPDEHHAILRVRGAPLAAPESTDVERFGGLPVSWAQALAEHPALCAEVDAALLAAAPFASSFFFGPGYGEWTTVVTDRTTADQVWAAASTLAKLGALFEGK